LYLPGLRQKIFTALSVKQFSAVLAEYAQEEIISITDSVVSKTGINTVLTQKQSDDLMAIEMLYRKNHLTPPDWEDVMKSMQIPDSDAAEYAAWLFENKRLTRAADMIFASAAVKEAEKTLRSKFEIFTMAEARDEFDSTRKYIQPLLEYFDAQNITVREGNYRRFL
jgi:selenocysteine-specific elongation factor